MPDKLTRQSRNAAIIDMRLHGASWRQIAATIGLTRRYCRMLCVKQTGGTTGRPTVPK